MLILSRRREEKIVMPGLGITILVMDVRNGLVRIGIDAPPNIEVHRSEVWEAIQRDGRKRTDRIRS